MPTNEEFNEYAQYTPPSAGGNFLKFENNVEVIVRILSDTVVFESVFTDKDTQETSVSTKYAWLVWDFASKEAKIMQLPVGGYKSVAQFGKDPEYGNPKDYNMKIMRTGTGFDTKYQITPSPKKAPLLEQAPEAEGKTDVNILEILSKNDSNQHVFWLKDLLKGDTEKKPMPRDMVDAADYPAKDNEPTDEDLEKDPEIALKDIPF